MCGSHYDNDYIFQPQLLKPWSPDSQHYPPTPRYYVFFPVQADSSSYANYQSLNSQQPAKSVSVGGPNAVLEIRAWNARSMALFAY
ncbi:hypothetical protein PENARI_c268G10420 [Penicillium arizonense]|uniref:Uncharacterized protein n=1 Tax=Penicillium arizonense TaxID=1835702 RepID=A0A1F5L0G4_PENAI|nr:hypothetical protein PENARI_c268G10420 [Penicillium arizonense]OGE46431.1 hypothetical protein PENARI_c268G10420 [Penicillium arizonense]